MPVEPRWLTLNEVLAAHEVQPATFGGAAGIRDIGLIESAVTSPRQRWHYARETDLLSLAVALCCALVRNHGFIDGNKRTGVVALTAFLRVNGFILDMPNDTRFGRMIEDVINRKLDEEAFADLLYQHVVAI